MSRFWENSTRIPDGGTVGADKARKEPWGRTEGTEPGPEAPTLSHTHALRALLRAEAGLRPQHHVRSPLGPRHQVPRSFTGGASAGALSWREWDRARPGDTGTCWGGDAASSQVDNF